MRAVTWQGHRNVKGASWFGYNKLYGGTEGFATHHLSLEDAPKAYADFQSKSEGTVKVVFRP